MLQKGWRKVQTPFYHLNKFFVTFWFCFLKGWIYLCSIRFGKKVLTWYKFRFVFSILVNYIWVSDNSTLAWFVQFGLFWQWHFIVFELRGLLNWQSCNEYTIILHLKFCLLPSYINLFYIIYNVVFKLLYRLKLHTKGNNYVSWAHAILGGIYHSWAIFDTTWFPCKRSNDYGHAVLQQREKWHAWLSSWDNWTFFNSSDWYYVYV